MTDPTSIHAAASALADAITAQIAAVPTVSQGTRGDGTVGPVPPPPPDVAAAAAANAATLAAAVASKQVPWAGDPPHPEVTKLFDFATIGALDPVTLANGPQEITIAGHNFVPGSRIQFINPTNTTYQMGATVEIAPDGTRIIARYDLGGQTGLWQVRNMTAIGTPSALALLNVTRAA